MDGEFLRAMKNIDKTLKGEMDKEITRRLQARNQSGQPFR